MSTRKKLIRENEIRAKRAMRMAKKVEKVKEVILHMLDDLRPLFSNWDAPTHDEIELVLHEYKKQLAELHKENRISKELLAKTQKFLDELNDSSIPFSGFKTAVHDYALGCRKESAALMEQASSSQHYVRYLVKANCR